MVYCCSICGNEESSKNRHLIFHRLPKDEMVKKEWLRVMDKKNLKTAKVCSIHFRKEDYRELCNKPLLKKGAVPHPPVNPLQFCRTEITEIDTSCSKSVNNDLNLGVAITLDADQKTAESLLESDKEADENVEYIVETSFDVDQETVGSILEERQEETDENIEYIVENSLDEDQETTESLLEREMETDENTENVESSLDGDLETAESIVEGEKETDENFEYIESSEDSSEEECTTSSENESGSKRRNDSYRESRVPKKKYCCLKKYGTFRRDNFANDESWDRFLRLVEEFRKQERQLKRHNRRLLKRVENMPTIEKKRKK